jgi:putative restriction endonuclease
MRYWWVNQNQTYRHEVQGGYLWSPKRNANGARNPFYESMREVAPGDLIFSFMDTRILALGIAQSYCWESPKPLEFGNAGQNWENVGWKVKVNFTELVNKIRPKDHIEILRPLLPERYSHEAWRIMAHPTSARFPASCKHVSQRAKGSPVPGSPI